MMTSDGDVLINILPEIVVPDQVQLKSLKEPDAIQLQVVTSDDAVDALLSPDKFSY